MAIDTSVEQAAKTVANILHDYARGQGWSPESYRIFIRVNTDWGLIHVTFIAQAFEGQSESDQYKSYDDIMDYLECHLKDDPELYTRIGLVTRGLEGYSWFANPRLSPGEVEIDDALLNPGVEDFRRLFRPNPR